jgi:hypothetical protein
MLWKKLKDEKCKKLEGKNKILLIKECRGKKMDVGIKE